MECFGQLVLEEDVSVGFGTSRNNRGVNKLVYSIGGEKVGSSLAHGCEVDLVLIKTDIVHEIQLSYSNIFKKLWKEKIDFHKRMYEKNLSQQA